jgi:hypothetical protein
MYMKAGLGGEKRVLHAVDDCTRIHFVFTLLNDKLDSMIKCLKAIAAYVFRQYGLIIKVWRHDSLPTLIQSTRYDDWIMEEGYAIEVSSPYTQAQNGGPERAGGVIALKATSLLGDSKLPEKLWPEAVTTVGYLLNRTPTRILDWKTPFQFLYTWLKLPEPRVALHHLVPFGSKAYVHIKKRPKLDKVKDRAFIGWHCGYDSTNIYRVWAPSQHRIISVRDVTFDTSQRYRPDEEEEPGIEAIIRLYEVPNIDDPEGHVIGLPIQGPLQPFESTLETYGDTITVDDPQLSVTVTKPTATVPGAGGLPSPNLTPEPDSQITTGVTAPGLPTHSDSPVLVTGQPQIDAVSTENTTITTLDFGTSSATTSPPIEGLKKPRKVTKSKGYHLLEEGEELDTSKRISRDVVPRNIIEGKRSTRRGTALLAYQHLDQESGYCAAFMTGTNHNPRRFHGSELPPPPKNAHQLENHPHKEGFIIAAQKEYDSLLAKGTFEEVAIKETNNAYIIPNMWVYTYKLDTDGFLERYKARLVIRGDLTRSIYEDTYAATLASRVFRCLIAIAAFFSLELYQLDAVNAFCNAPLDELLYTLDPGGRLKRGHCLRVIRALYGMPRSPLLWFNHLTATMERLGFKPVPECACLYTNGQIIVFFYVDDIVIMVHPQHHTAFLDFKARLMREYEMRDMGELKWFLGIRVTRDRLRRRIWLSQDSYIRKICAQYSITLDNRKAPKTPLPSNILTIYEDTATPHEIHDYQQRVGSITYPSAITRADNAQASSILARFNINPGPDHLRAVNHNLAYLLGTCFYALEFGGAIEGQRVFMAASDASYADDVSTRCSTEGYLFQLFGGTIDWKCVKQSTVTTSTTEAELLALAHVCAWLLWWGRFFVNINLDIDEDLTALCDNLQTIRLMTKDAPKLVTKLRHIDVTQHWLRQEVQAGKIKIEWTSTNDMAADGLTKALPRQKHEHFVNQLNIVDITGLIEG